MHPSQSERQRQLAQPMACAMIGHGTKRKAAAGRESQSRRPPRVARDGLRGKLESLCPGRKQAGCADEHRITHGANRVIGRDTPEGFRIVVEMQVPNPSDRPPQ